MENILVLDDSKNLLQMIKTIFQLHNYEVRTAATRSSLMAHIDIFKPDIILMDVLLNKSNGREICKEIKQMNKAIHIILMSTNPKLLENYLEYNADDIIEKPFDNDEVLNKIIQILSSKLISVS